MDLGDTSSKSEHAAEVDSVVNGLLVSATFASCNVFDAPFVHQTPAASSLQSSSAVLETRKVKPGKFGDRVRDKIHLIQDAIIIIIIIIIIVVINIIIIRIRRPEVN